MSIRIFLSAALVLSAYAVADNPGVFLSSDGIASPLAYYRESRLSQADFDAFLGTIPPDDRAAFLRSPERVERTLVNMMLGQRALDLASQSDSLTEQPLSGRIRLEAGRVAVDELRDQFLAQHMLEDYTEVARELFLSRRDDFALPLKVDFSHVIIAPAIDGDPVAAMRMIIELHDQAQEHGDLRELAEAIGEAGEDFRAGGHHELIGLDELERILAQHLYQMRPGEISEPLRTASGWHLVQLTRRHEAEIPDFEAVREQAISIARARHREELIGRFRNELLAGGLEIPEGAIREMLSRHGVTWTREES